MLHGGHDMPNRGLKDETGIRFDGFDDPTN